MRNKKIFSFDEEKDAISVITNGFVDNCIDYSKMYLVAKYIRQKFSYGEIRLERELIRFCKEQDKNFNAITEAEHIKKWVKTAMEYGLRKTNAVYISKKEIDFLQSIETPKDRKILFVTLVLAKALKQKSTKLKDDGQRFSNSFYIHYSNLLDIARLSKIKGLTKVGLSDILFCYKEYFEFYNAEKELIKLLYVDEVNSGDYEISDFDKILDYYEDLFGKNKTYCIMCGTEIIKASNKQKYCKECLAIVRREQKKLWIRKHRTNVEQ